MFQKCHTISPAIPTLSHLLVNQAWQITKKPAAALQCSQSIFEVCFVWKEMYLNFYKLFSSSYRCMVMTIFYNVLSGVPTIFWHKHYNYYSLAILRCLALPKRCSKRNFIFAKEMDLAAAYSLQQHLLLVLSGFFFANITKKYCTRRGSNHFVH